MIVIHQFKWKKFLKWCKFWSSKVLVRFGDLVSLIILLARNLAVDWKILLNLDYMKCLYAVVKNRREEIWWLVWSINKVKAVWILNFSLLPLQIIRRLPYADWTGWVRSTPFMAWDPRLTSYTKLSETCARYIHDAFK